MKRPSIIEDGSAPLKLDSNQSNSDRLLATFNQIRDELISTLWFILGNKDDAQDIAQDAFLRCWKKQDALPDVLNLKAWIFKVAINAAKDLRKSAWKRKTRTMPEEDVMMYKSAVSPLESLQENEMVILKLVEKLRSRC